MLILASYTSDDMLCTDDSCPARERWCARDELRVCPVSSRFGRIEVGVLDDVERSMPDGLPAIPGGRRRTGTLLMRRRLRLVTIPC